MLGPYTPHDYVPFVTWDEIMWNLAFFTSLVAGLSLAWLGLHGLSGLLRRTPAQRVSQGTVLPVVLLWALILVGLLLVSVATALLR